MKKILLLLLLSLGCSIVFGQETINHQVNYVVRPTFSNQPISTLTELANTNAGSEGITKIGAFGNYALDEFIEDTSLKGPARDLPVFTYTNGWYPVPSLVVSYSSGDVYDPNFGYRHLVSGTNTLVNNSVNYAYWATNSPNVIQWTTGSRPDPNSSIYLAEFSTAFGAIINVKETTSVGDLPLQTADGHASVMPSLIVSGITAYPTGTNLTNIAVSSGIEYQDMSKRNTHNAQDLGNTNVTQSMLIYFHTNSSWSWMSTNSFPIGLWDDGTNVISCDTSKWYRGIFVSMAGQPFINYVMPDYGYTNYENAVAADDPDLPPGFDPYIPRITAYIFSGQDISLRNDTTYWLDRRFMIRRGTLSTGGGSSGSTPTLQQVLTSGKGTGGILPNGAGLPTAPDELTSKAYVDSTINNINQQQAYVDKNGNDTTAIVNSSILPFKTIQAAIDAAAVVAGNTNRYNIHISPGIYDEDITMKNYVSISGNDIESTVINGSVTYPHAYDDIIGAEVSLLTITSSNTPALVLDPGDDNAYMGVRSCFLNTTYSDESITNKSVVVIYRGISEIYATSYLDLEIFTTNGPIQHCQIFEHKTDFANQGLSQFTSIGSSCIINSYDINDEISLMLTHTNSDTRCINTVQGGVFNVHLELATLGVCSNNFKLVSHRRAIGRSLAQGIVTRLYLPQTNSCNVFMGYCENGIGDNVTILRNNHIRIVSGATSNIWLGAAIGTNDTLRVLDTQYIQDLSDYPYPKVYTNAGSLGKYFINTPHANGDHLFGSAMDLSAINSTSVSAPDRGHLKIYANTYAGLENPMFKDSSGNIIRFCRDNFYNGFNDDTNDMSVGDAVYISSGLSTNNTPKIKKCIASDVNTLPCAGLVAQVGGIVTGSIGRVMIMGRLESTMDTSSFTSGQKIYVSDTVRGGLTNVAPSGSSYAQIIGTAHLIGTNGYINVRPWSPDMLGSLPPSSYATTNWASGSNNTINAATLEGYTAHQLTAASAIYYVWGSLAGSFTNPASKLAKLDSPYGQPVWTSIVTGASVTNGLFLGYACLNTNEAPRFMQGKNDIHIQIERDGDASARTMRVYRSIYESNQTTVVETIQGGTKEVLNSRGDLTYTIAPTSTVNIADYNRLVVYYFRLESGWTGTETIKVYSQNGELTYITLASAPGVYLPMEEYNRDRIGWDSASNWVTSSSSGVANVFSNTSNWNSAYVYINANSNGINYTLSRTSAWDAAATVIRFKAGLQTNITLLTGVGQFTFTNVLLAASGGSEYVATNSRWYPRTTGKVIEFMGGQRIDTVQNGIVHYVSLYKNGSELSRVHAYRSANAADSFTLTWNYIEEVNTSTNDYYEVWYSSGNASTTVGAGTNNWWSGTVE